MSLITPAKPDEKGFDYTRFFASQAPLITKGEVVSNAFRAQPYSNSLEMLTQYNGVWIQTGLNSYTFECELVFLNRFLPLNHIQFCVNACLAYLQKSHWGEAYEYLHPSDVVAVQHATVKGAYFIRILFTLDALLMFREGKDVDYARIAYEDNLDIETLKSGDVHIPFEALLKLDPHTRWRELDNLVTTLITQVDEQFRTYYEPGFSDAVYTISPHSPTLLAECVQRYPSIIPFFWFDYVVIENEFAPASTYFLFDWNVVNDEMVATLVCEQNMTEYEFFSHQQLYELNDKIKLYAIEKGEYQEIATPIPAPPQSNDDPVYYRFYWNTVKGVQYIDGYLTAPSFVGSWFYIRTAEGSNVKVPRIDIVRVDYHPSDLGSMPIDEDTVPYLPQFESA